MDWIIFFFVLALISAWGIWRRRPGIRRARWTRDVWKPRRVLAPWSKKSGFTCQDSYNHTLIMGATGSGKTSGSGRTVAEAMLKAGYGGLVLLVKDDWSFWKGLCKATKRYQDLIRFSPSDRWRFNFLNEELRRTGRGGGQTENIVQLLCSAMETLKRNSGGDSNRENGGFWRDALAELLRNSIDLASMSLGRIRIRELYDIVYSAPDSVKEAMSDHWGQNSFCAKCLDAGASRAAASKRHDLDAVARYFLKAFPKLAPNTRESIRATFSVMADCLQRGVLPELLCGETNVTPAAATHGNIIVVDMPLIEFGAVGMLASGLWKYAFQRGIERRNVRKNPRPVFLWIDEAQFLITSHDFEFLSTCRSSRVATVYLTQNLPSLYAALGGRQKAESEVDALCGNFCTKIFHANGDPVTNRWASEMIGRSRQFLVNANNSYDTDGSFGGMPSWGQRPKTSAGVSEHIDFEVQPSAFGKLRTGGRAHGRNVDAIVLRNETFADTGRVWRLATFRQKR